MNKRVIEPIEILEESPKKVEFKGVKGFLMKAVDKLDSDYLSFILGFVSSIVIEDIYTLFGMNIAADYTLFTLKLSNTVLVTAACMLLLKFSIGFSGLQKQLSSSKTVRARENYIADNAEEIEKTAESLTKNMLSIGIFLGGSIIVNIANFLYINLCNVSA